MFYVPQPHSLNPLAVCQDDDCIGLLVVPFSNTFQDRHMHVMLSWRKTFAEYPRFSNYMMCNLPLASSKFFNYLPIRHSFAESHVIDIRGTIEVCTWYGVFNVNLYSFWSKSFYLEDLLLHEKLIEKIWISICGVSRSASETSHEVHSCCYIILVEEYIQTCLVSVFSLSHFESELRIISEQSVPNWRNSDNGSYWEHRVWRILNCSCCWSCCLECSFFSHNCCAVRESFEKARRFLAHCLYLLER